MVSRERLLTPELKYCFLTLDQEILGRKNTQKQQIKLLINTTAMCTHTDAQMSNGHITRKECFYLPKPAHSAERDKVHERGNCRCLFMI